MALYSINDLDISGPAVCKRFVLWVYCVGIFWDLPPLGHFSFLPLSFMYFYPHKLLTNCLLPGGFQRSHLLWCVKDVGCSLQDEPVTHRKCSFTNIFWDLSPLASFRSLNPHGVYLILVRLLRCLWQQSGVFDLSRHLTLSFPEDGVNGFLILHISYSFWKISWRREKLLSPTPLYHKPWPFINSTY